MQILKFDNLTLNIRKGLILFFDKFQTIASLL